MVKNKKTIKLSDIKLPKIGGPPIDEKAVELMKLAYQDKIEVHKTLIKNEYIQPFSIYRPKEDQVFTNHYIEKINNKEFPHLYVYAMDDKFVMSDDYFAYYFYLSIGYPFMPCIVLGDFNSRHPGIELPPTRMKILPLELEIIDNKG